MHTALIEPSQAAADRLAKRSDVWAVCLLGSAARGDADAKSDIDLLVLTDAETRPTQLLSELADLGSSDKLSLIVQTRERFSQLTERGALLAVHVHEEGRILVDKAGWLRRQLDATQSTAADPDWTFAWAAREVRRYERIERFNDLYLFALARLYSIGRAVAIALSVKGGTPAFGKDQPFDAARLAFPDFEPQLGRLAALRPFFERAAGGEDVELPFDHHGAGSVVQVAVDDIKRLVRAAG